MVKHVFNGPIATNLLDQPTFTGNPRTKQQQYELVRKAALKMAEKLVSKPMGIEHVEGAPTGSVTKTWFDQTNGSWWIEFEIDDSTEFGQNALLLIQSGAATQLSLKHRRSTLEPIEVSIVVEGARPGCHITGYASTSENNPSPYKSDPDIVEATAGEIEHQSFPLHLAPSLLSTEIAKYTTAMSSNNNSGQQQQLPMGFGGAQGGFPGQFSFPNGAQLFPLGGGMFNPNMAQQFQSTPSLSDQVGMQAAAMQHQRTMAEAVQRAQQMQQMKEFAEFEEFKRQKSLSQQQQPAREGKRGNQMDQSTDEAKVPAAAATPVPPATDNSELAAPSANKRARGANNKAIPVKQEQPAAQDGDKDVAMDTDKDSTSQSADQNKSPTDPKTAFKSVVQRLVESNTNLLHRGDATALMDYGIESERKLAESTAEIDNLKKELQRLNKSSQSQKLVFEKMREQFRQTVGAMMRKTGRHSEDEILNFNKNVASGGMDEVISMAGDEMVAASAFWLQSAPNATQTPEDIELERRKKTFNEFMSTSSRRGADLSPPVGRDNNNNSGGMAGGNVIYDSLGNPFYMIAPPGTAPSFAPPPPPVMPFQMPASPMPGPSASKSMGLGGQESDTVAASRYHAGEYKHGKGPAESKYPAGIPGMRGWSEPTKDFVDDLLGDTDAGVSDQFHVPDTTGFKSTLGKHARD